MFLHECCQMCSASFPQTSGELCGFSTIDHEPIMFKMFETIWIWHLLLMDRRNWPCSFSTNLTRYFMPRLFLCVDNWRLLCMRHSKNLQIILSSDFAGRCREKIAWCFSESLQTFLHLCTVRVTTAAHCFEHLLQLHVIKFTFVDMFISSMACFWFLHNYHIKHPLPL